MSYGPWSPEVDDAERRRQLRALAALALVFLGDGDPLVDTLRMAEVDPQALGSAFDLLERAPALKRRRMLAVLSRVTFGRRR